jgi:hypothetical protein
VKDAGVYPSDPSPAASWTLSQSRTYANKLPGLSRVSSAFGTRVSDPYAPKGLAKATRTTTALCPTTTGLTPTTALCGPPASKWISIYNDPEPNSYYGYQCGPAAGHNALGAYGVNYPVGTGYYPSASYLTQEMRTDSNGTVHTWMPGSLNSHESQNTYVWQTLGTPAGSTNGTADLLNYTVTDIWYNDSQIQHRDLREGPNSEQVPLSVHPVQRGQHRALHCGLRLLQQWREYLDFRFGRALQPHRIAALRPVLPGRLGGNPQ